MSFLNKNHSLSAPAFPAGRFGVKHYKTNSPKYSGVNKTVKLFITLFFLVVVTNAQKIEHEGKEYHIKGNKIFLNDLDVTANLTIQQLADIRNKLKNKLAREERISTAEKATKKAEKKQQKAKKNETLEKAAEIICSI